MGTQSRRKTKPKSAGARPPAAATPQSADSREQEILRAAFDVFTEKGFHGATMLDVANRARASKSTLYAHHADKESLFRALIAWGTRQGTHALDAIVSDQTLDPLTALHRYAAKLLSLMLQPEKLALFRIAVAEGDRLPDIGRIFSAFTRDHGVELGRAIAARLVRERLIEIDDADEYGHSFIGLLQGELYTRALLGTIAVPSGKEIEKHAKRAMTRLVRAYAPSRKQGPGGQTP
jgi:TetR/AcrR family transcriptional regulator, mexJK operon transcriptional repressor